MHQFLLPPYPDAVSDLNRMLATVEYFYFNPLSLIFK